MPHYVAYSLKETFRKLFLLEIAPSSIIYVATSSLPTVSWPFWKKLIKLFFYRTFSYLFKDIRPQNCERKRRTVSFYPLFSYDGNYYLYVLSELKDNACALRKFGKIWRIRKCVFIIPAIVIWCIFLKKFLACVRTYAFFTWHF